MPGTLTVIWWRDIPAQVIAKDGRQAHKVVLHPRFQVAIDKAAMKAGKKTANDYIEEWRREGRPCGNDFEAEATGEAARLEAAYTKDVLARLVAAGGFDSERPAKGFGESGPAT
jgi:Virulence factor